MGVSGVEGVVSDAGIFIGLFISSAWVWGGALGGSWILGWVVATLVAAQGKGKCDQAIKPSENPVPFTDSYRTFSPFYLWLHSFHYNMRTFMFFLREVFLS